MSLLKTGKSCRILAFGILFVGAGAIDCRAADVVKDLSGTWRVMGENLSGDVRLPGTLADVKLGRRMTAGDWEKDTDRRSKGALTREYQYRGKAVYERTFELTEAEARYPLELVLERVMGYSEVSIDGNSIGVRDTLGTAHIYPIPVSLLTVGRHTIRLTLDNSNRYNFSEWAHSYGPVMQSVWHGVVGTIALRRYSPIRQSRVFASWPADGKLRVEVPDSFKEYERVELRKYENVKISNQGTPEKIAVKSTAPSPYRKGFTLIELALDREPEPWSEHHPNLYVLTLHDDATNFTHMIRFGFRSVTAHDHAIWINGNKWFMRGNLDCCHFPLTGAPDTTEAWWRETFRKLRDEDGINTIRFHSWTPPKAAFDAADEMGMMFVVEAGIWVDRWMKDADFLGLGKPIDAFVKREIRAILESYGNSPAFLALGIGNELGGCDFQVMGEWLNTYKAFDPRRLYTASTARSISPADDFVPTHRYPDVGMVRGRFKPSTDWDYEDVYEKTTLPTVAHEIGQWPIYVDWEYELSRYKGVLRPYNLEHFRDVAKKLGTERFWQRWSSASAHLNRLMYKDEVESFLRTPSCAGLQLLSTQDFTGQFEAMVGWRDSFYNIKPAVRKLPPFKDIFNNLPHLARFEKYTWRVGETYRATLLVRNLTEKPIPTGVEFRCVCADREEKYHLSQAIASGEVATVGEVSLPLSAKMAGKKHLLRFGANCWPFWVFDEKQEQAALRNGIVETSSFAEMETVLRKGGKVLYTGESMDCGDARFKPVYWSTGHFRNADAEVATLGYTIRADHPAFREFPTENWADWQWYRLVEGGFNHRLVGLPSDFEPIVIPVPDLHHSTRMGTIFELKVGEGKLLVCGCNLSDIAQPETCALRDSLLSYMTSNAFNPQTVVGFDWLKARFAPTGNAEFAPRPKQFESATIYIETAVGLKQSEKNIPWSRRHDRAELKQGSYLVSGTGWGTWRDATGTFWHGKVLTVTLNRIRPISGLLWVRFRDPNHCNRTGRGICEGRPFTIPKHQDAGKSAYWAKLAVTREDALDGIIEFSCEALTGPNLMIDRIVLMEEK